jgi:hypothetical protein
MTRPHDPQDEQDVDLSDGGELPEEDIGASSEEMKPYDPSQIRITTKNFSIRDVVTQIQEGEIDLSPDFQRDFVWNTKRKTRLIESVLLGIPLPAFYFSQLPDGTFQVVDGLQRLSTLRDFVGGSFILTGQDLEYLHGIANRGFSDLEPQQQRRLRSTQLVVHIIEPQTPDEVKFDIFGRVNTLGAPLSAQEIRHAMSRPRSRTLLQRMVELPSFRKATAGFFTRPMPGQPRAYDSKRMSDRELALRFIAFRDFQPDRYRQFASLDTFLVQQSRVIDGRDPAAPTMDDAALDAIVAAFDMAMKAAQLCLGKRAFRRVDPETGFRGPINRAVFESQALALARWPTEQLVEHAEGVAAVLTGAFRDRQYDRSITVGTGDVAAVAHRLAYPQQLLAELLS